MHSDASRGADRRHRVGRPALVTLGSCVAVVAGQPGPAARPDHLRHQARPPARPRRLPGAQPDACGTATRRWAGCRTRPRATSSRWVPLPARTRAATCRCGCGSGCGQRAVMLLAYEGMRRLAACLAAASAPAGAVLAGLTYMLAPRVLTHRRRAQRRDTRHLRPAVDRAAAGAYLRGRLAPGRASLLRRPRSRSWVARTPPGAGLPGVPGAAARRWSTGCRGAARLATCSVAGAASSCWRRCGGCCRCCCWAATARRSSTSSSPRGRHRSATGWLSSLRGTATGSPSCPGGGARLAGGLALSARPTCSSRPCWWPGWAARSRSTAAGERGSWWSPLLVGLFALTAGSGGLAGSLLDHPWTAALDGALAPFRNVHKFDPVVRLPLASAFAATAQAALAWGTRRRTHSRRVPATVVLAALAVPLLASSAPSWGWRPARRRRLHRRARLLAPGRRLPRDQPGPVRALVLPGAGFAIQTWGRTIDEPLQVLDPPPWSARSQIPLMPPGTIRLLDSTRGSPVAGRPEPHAVGR